MKLKKIVSLALAGVLAVSMLAGCSNNGSNNNNGSSSSEPTATVGAADAMNAAQDYVEFKDSTTSYLADAAKKATYAQLKAATVKADLKTTTNDAVASQLDGKVLPAEITLSTKVAAISGTGVGDKETVAYLYMVDDVVSEEVALSLVAQNLAVSAAYPVTVKSGSYNYEASYTGEVSVQKVSKADDLGEKTESAYYILVTVTQTVGDTAVTVG